MNGEVKLGGGGGGVRGGRERERRKGWMER